MANLLEIKNLSVEYKTGRAISKAVNGLNLTIGRGEALGLVGETGAGKTTTALSILKLLPSKIGRITSGSITFDGQQILDKREKEMNQIRGQNIAMIFQNPLSSLNPVFTIGEQVSMVLRKHSDMTKAKALEESAHLLELVGIKGDRLKEYPHQFSGGMRQRVGIAAALACNPDLLIADEPTTALDVTIQAQILELMRNLQHERSSSLLMITHNFGIVAELCQRVAVMYAGSVIEVGTTTEVFQSPMHKYTQGLLGALPRLDAPTERLAHIPGNVVNSQDLPSGCKFHPRCSACTEICKTSQPPLKHVSGQHYVACHNC